MENLLISIEELQDTLCIGKNTAYDLLRSGEVPCFKIGKTWKIPRQGVLDYINNKMGKQCVVFSN